MLDVGCGSNKQTGFIGMDRRDLPGIDIVHDAEAFPWPLDDESCGVVVMSHLIEHIKPWFQIDIIDEAWRVLEMGGVLMISTPYGLSFRYAQDPTHCSPWVEATVEYFIKGTPLYDVYQPKPWELVKRFWNIRGDIEIAIRKVEENAEKET